MGAMVRVRTRSHAAAPFHYATWLRVPVEWMELDIPLNEVADLMRHPWIETEPLEPVEKGEPFDPRPPGTLVRVRALSSVLPQPSALGGIGSQVSVVAASEQQLADLRANRQLEVRPHDEAMFPSWMFVRVRAPSRPGVAIGAEWYESNWIARRFPFDEFSQHRADPRLEVTLLDPESAPPLRPVRLQSNTGRPYFFMHAPIPADHAVEMALYPREIERATHLGHLVVEEIDDAHDVSDARDGDRDANAELTLAEVGWLTEPPAPDVPKAVEESEDHRTQPNAAPAPERSTLAFVQGESVGARLRKWATRVDVCSDGRARGGYLLDEIVAALELPSDSRSRAVEMEIASALRMLGWEHLPMRRREGARVRPYLPPAPR